MSRLADDPHVREALRVADALAVPYDSIAEPILSDRPARTACDAIWAGR